MRIGLASWLVTAAFAAGFGCTNGGDGGGNGGGGGGGNGGGGGPPPPEGCGSDADCSPNVCARDGECLPADEVMAIRVTWTVNGSAANGTTCSSIPDLYLQFFASAEDGVGFAPVPCAEGNFSVDKMPSRFVNVEIGINNGADLGDSTFDGSGDVSFDLVPPAQ
jgi:hypothetical protein